MGIVIALLKEAIKHYEQNHFNVGDECLQQAVRIRRETKKAEKLAQVKGNPSE